MKRPERFKADWATALDFQVSFFVPAGAALELSGVIGQAFPDELPCSEEPNKFRSFTDR